MTVIEYMKFVRETLGEFEFRAISPQGHVIQSKGWKEQTYSLEINPQIPPKDNHDRLADGSTQHSAKTPAAKGKHKTRTAS